jgi:hypothetical protein
MMLNVRIQDSLAVAHMAEDDGDFIFVLCRTGFERCLGRHTDVGERILVGATLKEYRRIGGGETNDS